MVKTKKFKDYIVKQEYCPCRYYKYIVKLTMSNDFTQETWHALDSEINSYITDFYYSIDIKYYKDSNKIIYTYWTD